jgi:hypothetical protein
MAPHGIRSIGPSIFHYIFRAVVCSIACALPYALSQLCCQPYRPLCCLLYCVWGVGISDEIDAIAGKRESAQHDMGRRIVAQMLTCMDDLALEPPPQGAESQDEAQPPLDPPSVKGHVFVIGAVRLCVQVVRQCQTLPGWTSRTPLAVDTKLQSVGNQ